MFHLVLVAAGGAIGASLRHLVNLGSLRLAGPGFPWGTTIINIVGAFVMGVFIGFLARRGGSETLRIFIATGILGGFTTFSAFSLDFAVLWERGSILPAVGYAAASVLGSLFAIFMGLWLARMAG